ncbi:MAG: hypothetical protein AAFQ07_18120, partial [Chloroflexota bacterium]
MTVNNPEGTHQKYTDTDRHFSPCSEKYTGADSLITAERNGWRTMNIVYSKTIRMGGGRETTLYYFKLVRNGQDMIMPVVRNPYVTSLLARRNIRVQPRTDKSRQTIESPAVSEIFA